MAAPQVPPQSQVILDLTKKRFRDDDALKIRLLSTVDQSQPISNPCDPRPEERYLEYPYLYKQEKIILMPDLVRQALFTSTVRHALWGVFSLLNFVYFVVDNKVFLWEYERANDNDAIAYIDVPERSVTNVQLVKARPNYWIDAIQYIMTVVTEEKIHICGISRENKKTAIYNSPSEVYHSPTTLAVKMIVGSDNGRIFLIAQSDLYELIYQEEGWFRPRINLVNLRSSSILPNWSIFRSGAPVKYLTIDNTRRTLFVLLEDNTIEMYFLGQDGNSFISKGRFDQSSKERMRLKRQIGDNNMMVTVDPGDFISIHAVSKTESAQYCLVAVSESGHRWYFSCTNNSPYASYLYPQPIDSRIREPDSITFAHILSPPPIDAPSTTTGRLSNKFQMARYYHGLFFAKRIEGDQTTLIQTAPNFGAIYEQLDRNQVDRGSVRHYELYCVSTLGPARNLYEITEKYSPLCDPNKNDAYFNELISQFANPKRSFVLLTEKSVTMWTKMRPVDFLSVFLERFEQDSNATELDKFRRNYGDVETSAMCFYIATPSSRNLLMQLRVNLARTPFTLPELSNAIIVIGSPRDTNPNRMDTNIPQAILDEITPKLLKTKLFLETYPDFGIFPQSGDRTLQQPPDSLIPLYELLVKCADTIQFVRLMIGYNLPEILSSLSERSRKAIAESTYEELVTNNIARKNWQELVLAIIKRENGPHVDTLSRALETYCKTFCNAADVQIFRAYEELQNAKVVDGSTAPNSLSKALGLFCEGIENMTFGTLENICTEFQQLGYHSGAITLALSGANKLDVSHRQPYYDLVINIMRDADVFSDRPTYYDEQQRDVVLDTALTDAANLNDKGFIFAVYDEFFRAGTIRRLFELPYPYLDEYFQHNITPDEVGLIKQELYCDYCTIRNNSAKAAEIRYNLAHSRDFNINLDKRLEYLSRCVADARSAQITTDTREMVERLRIYEDSLRVAHVQHEIKLELEARGIRADELDRNLIERQQLFEDYAEKYNLHEIKLSLFSASARPHMLDVANVWREIIDNCKYFRLIIIRPSFDAAAEVVIRLGRKFAPRDLYVFPIGYPPRGSLVRVLLMANATFHDIYEALDHLINEKPLPLHERDATIFMLGELAELLTQWIQSGQLMYHDINRILNSYSRYLLAAQSLSNGPATGPLANEFADIEIKLRSLS
ncbi:532_t:CDS:10 [Paraglomus occultum]|uniref:532_t:CDS:1 n=1 Tax=Paraglomus occultum TaxID=144539 RepID=A0A9N8ZIM9_9GLOM|nr:532_t:CDS:10 [Paraglomus occultum]